MLSILQSENQTCATVSYDATTLATARGLYSHSDCSADIGGTTACAICDWYRVIVWTTDPY